MPNDIAPLIVEVRANEATDRQTARHIPYSPAEIAADATDCATAGAAVYHWHARTEEGRVVDDPAAFIAAAAAIRNATDIILKPTLGFDRSSAEARIAHVVEMKRAGSDLIDIAPADNFSANADGWDPAARRFVDVDAIYANTRGHIIDVIERLHAIDIAVSLVCTDVASVRAAMRYREMGLFDGPMRIEFAVSGGAMDVFGGPSLPVLATMVSFLRPGDVWSVLLYGGDIFEAAGTIIAMGGHIAIGLGDYPYRRFGDPTNAQLVEKLRLFAEIAGRPVATPARARSLLNLRECAEPLEKRGVLA